MRRALADVPAGAPPPPPPSLPAKQRGKSLCHCQTEGTLIIPWARERGKKKGGAGGGGICMWRSQQNTNAAGGELQRRHTLPLHWSLPPARRCSRTKQRETKPQGFLPTCYSRKRVCFEGCDAGCSGTMRQESDIRTGDL